MISVVQAFIAFFAAHQPKSSLDQEGRIDKVLEPQKRWRVFHKASFWPARSHLRADFRPGDSVKIVDRVGITLYIEPADEED